MKTPIKPFAEQGNYISMHRILFDEVMPVLSPNGWKVLCFIVRKTVGWQKEFDVISYSQIQVGTGIGSRNAVSLTLHELQGEEPVYDGRRIEAWLPIPEKPHLINAYKGERRSDGTMGTTCYSLNAEVELQPSMFYIPGGSAKYVKHTDNNQSPFRKSDAKAPRESAGSGQRGNSSSYRDEPEFDFPEELCND